MSEKNLREGPETPVLSIGINISAKLDKKFPTLEGPYGVEGGSVGEKNTKSRNEGSSENLT